MSYSRSLSYCICSCWILMLSAWHADAQTYIGVRHLERELAYAVTATLHPDKSTTIRFGDAELLFPAGCVQREVEVSARVLKASSPLPPDIDPLTAVHYITLSDDSAYQPHGKEATLRFNTSAGLIYHANDNLTRWTAQRWTAQRGMKSDQALEMHISTGHFGRFVVGTRPATYDDSNAPTLSSYDKTTSPSDVRMRKGPYLMLTGSRSDFEMSVLWQTQDNMTVQDLQWSRHDGGLAQSAKALEGDDFPSKFRSHDFTYHYIIHSLDPGARYNYKVVLTDGTDSWAYHGEFLAPPVDKAVSTTFYAYGDTRTNPATHNDVVHCIFHDANDNGLGDIRQTFVLNTGDFVHRGLEEKYWDNDYFHYRSYISTNKFLASFPIMASIGNHEFYDNDANYTGTAGLFRKYWPSALYPDAHSYYYSFDYGPVHIAVIDPYTSPYSSDADPQYAWLKADLEGTDKQWKVVAVHQPFYDAGTGSPRTPSGSYVDTEVMQKRLQPILEANNVKLVLQGHRHYYSRSTVNNITYLVLGGGGASLTDLPDKLPSYDVPPDRKAKIFHFARIEVDTTSMRVEVIRVHNGEPDHEDDVTIHP